MTPAAVMDELRGAGVRIALRPDGRLDLSADAPPPAGLLDRVRQHRDGLVLMLLREAQDAPVAPAAASPAVAPADAGAEPPTAAPDDDPDGDSEASWRPSMPHVPDPDPMMPGLLRAALMRPH